MAHILTCYYRPDRGGLYNRLLRAMRALAEAGHTVHYLSVAPFPIQHPGCRFHRFPWSKEKTHTLLFWACFHLFAPVMLAGLALRWRITHAFGFSPTYAFLLKPACLLRRIGLSCFVHGDAISAHRLNRRPAWVERLDSWIENCAIHDVRLIVLQQHLLEMIAARHPGASPRDIILLPNDLPHSEGQKRCTLRWPLRLAMVGALERVKNHRLALEILSIDKPSRYSLHIYGLGSEEKRLKATVESKGLEGRVHFHGWVPAERIWPQVDFLLVPSLHEGMPEVVLEAIANHVPILAGNIPAHRDLLPSRQRLPLDRPSIWLDRLNRITPEYERVALEQMAHGQRFRFNWERRVVDTILWAV
jgi:glycosyltransferase involved in cell wall biosynthesis